MLQGSFDASTIFPEGLCELQPHFFANVAVEGEC